VKRVLRRPVRALSGGYVEDTPTLCAYCHRSMWSPEVADLPNPYEAKCWDCFLRDYEPPKLPWWSVAA
jgi:hypothetical protein